MGLARDVTNHAVNASNCLRIAAAYSKWYPEARIVTAKVEVYSAAFHFDHDVGVLISACLFGDGASAQVWWGRFGPYAISEFESVYRPAHGEDLGFVNHQVRSKNRLRKTVPFVMAESVASLVSKK